MFTSWIPKIGVGALACALVLLVLAFVRPKRMRLTLLRGAYLFLLGGLILFFYPMILAFYEGLWR